jgi:hypothetical protein
MAGSCLSNVDGACSDYVADSPSARRARVVHADAQKVLEVRGIDPRTSRMLSERSTI